MSYPTRLHFALHKCPRAARTAGGVATEIARQLRRRGNIASSHALCGCRLRSP